MREFWKKTSLLYKLIAVMLTVVMVGTSLYFHFDRRYNAKANESGDFTYEVVYLPSGNSDSVWGEGGWLIGDIDKKFVDTSSVSFAVGVNSVDLNNISVKRTDGSSESVVYPFNVLYNYKTFNVGDKTYYLTTGFASTCNNVKDEFFISENKLFEINIGPSDFVSSMLYVTATIGEEEFNGGTFNTLGTNSVLTVNVSSPKEITDFTVFGESASLGTAVYNEQTKLYEYPAYTYNFGTVNGATTKEYTDTSVVVGYGDTEGTNKKTLTATALKYDGTAPIITATLGNHASNSYDVAFDGTDKWYGSTTAPITGVKFAASSGNDTGCESELSHFYVGGVDVIGSGAEHKMELNEGVTTGVVISATDLAGNTSGDKTYIFKIDNTKPVVSTVQTLRSLSDGNMTISGTITDKLADEVTEGSGADKVYVKIDKTDNSAFCAEKEFSVGDDGTFSLDLTDFTEINEDALANGTYDGNGYKITIKAKDKAGNFSDSWTDSFDIDATKPVIATTLERHATGAADNIWEVVPADEIDAASNTYYINNINYDKVRYKINVTEDNLATTNPVVCKKLNDEVLGNFTVDGTDPAIYYYEIATSDTLLSKNSALGLKAVVEDKVGNLNEDDNQLLLPKLQLVDADIKVELLEVWCNGEKIADATSIANLKTDFNSKYTIKVVAKSGFSITELELRRGDETPAYAAIPTANIGDSVDSTGIHKTNSNEFTLPSGTNNEAFGSLKIYVKNSNNDTKEVTIGDLLYDNTNPFMTLVDKETGAAVNYTKWYQGITVKYEIKSGESAVESKLGSAKFTIDGQETALTPTGTSLTGEIQVPESTSTTGTNVTFDAKDKATNAMSASSGVFNIKVDKTAPSVAPLTVNGEAVDADTILAGAPQLTSTVTDNLTINNYHVSVLYNGAAYADYPVLVQKDETSESINYTLQQLLGDKTLNDGRYDVSVIAWDKSGRDSNVSSTAFVVDNTAPVLTADIVGGTSGKSNGFYNTDVTVRLTCKDNNFNPAAMVVTDNGNVVNADWKVGTDVYYADIVLSSEGMHNIIVSGNDKAGNAAVPKQATFTIDKTTPAVTLLVNGGQVYNESRGTLNLTGPLTLTASVSDTNEDAGDLQIQVIKTVPDTATTTSAFMPTSERTFSFAEEADYTINIFAVDKANNQGPTRTISFRVDTNAPQLTITGANGGTSASATTVSFNLNEAFWSDAKGTVEIYRKAGDGVDEVLFKTLTLTPTQKNYSLSEVLTETGIYRFEFTANDKVGHTATTSQKVTVDRNKPEITLSGVKNYDSTDGEVSISAIIKDEFYANKKVSISGTRLGADGKKVQLSFSPFAATANPTTISDTFKEEGIYDITITSTDIAGNVSTSSVHFTIDTSKPNIGDLSDFDGKTFNKKTFNELNLDELELDNLVSDLTVCQIRMYLNGSEYDGIDEIEDGSYTLLITAEDELGHKSEKTATFVIDTKDPVFIVTGVEDGEVKNEDYNIEVSLQLDEDKLEQVTLNGKDITLKNNEASLNVTEKGEYELYMKATDEAGNEAEQTITFTFGEESVASAVSDAVEKAASHWWMWAILVAAILAVGGFIFIILKRRKED